MKQEHTGNIQIGHRHAVLSSPTYQITAIRMNSVRKMFQMNCTAKQLISPNKNAHFRPCFFPGNANGNIYKFDSLCLYCSIRLFVVTQFTVHSGISPLLFLCFFSFSISGEFLATESLPGFDGAGAILS